jgi:hypothetical protein
MIRMMMDWCSPFEAPSYQMQMRLLRVTSFTTPALSNSQALKYGPSPFDVLWKKADPEKSADRGFFVNA